MSRRKAREIALQTMFQMDYNTDADPNAALDAACTEYEHVADTTRTYAHELVQGTKNHLPEIDRIIAGNSPDWKLERMAGVDRNITRLAIYEMNFGKSPLPPNVVINEAVELAKSFGTEDSGRFVNGILGSLAKKAAT
ncbi:transcription antitermination factor NusB [Acetonema longum]|uniref:Transcription antitermination protein NusB n=1 Tax=Acetonema longum DSM 6540 TaxID=1009370 RepID=F7NJY1_9FIRM|nr:transcription antitermination factor NusB [Acetonema longum]EGO63628.1 NusB antitermination factor [Acetonema longum DSM 6540]